MSKALTEIFNILNPPPVVGIVTGVIGGGVNVSTSSGIITVQGIGLGVGDRVVVRHGTAVAVRSNVDTPVRYV